MNANQQIKFYLIALSPLPYITTVIKKIKEGTKPTMELTSRTFKNEIVSKKKISKSKKAILDFNKLIMETGT